MNNEFEYIEINSQNGYPISAKICVPDGARRILIICHGFGGSMEGRTVSSLSPLLIERGIGVISFDWAGHGSSMMSGDYFTVKSCLRDLDSVYCFVEDKFPFCEICLAGTSFGGYMVLLYNSVYMRSVKRLVARCCAIDMAKCFKDKLAGSELKHLLDYGTLDFENDGRTLTVTKAYYEELLKNSVFDEFRPQHTQYLFVHGTNDEIAPHYLVKEFCEEHNIALESIEGADHFMSDDNKLAICNNTIIKFMVN